MYIVMVYFADYALCHLDAPAYFTGDDVDREYQRAQQLGLPLEVYVRARMRRFEALVAHGSFGDMGYNHRKSRGARPPSLRCVSVSSLRVRSSAH